jgi:hypothetical protein
LQKIKENLSLKRFFQKCIENGCINEQDRKALEEIFGNAPFPLLDKDQVDELLLELSLMVNYGFTGNHKMHSLRASFCKGPLRMSWIKVDTYADMYRRGNNVRLVHALLLKLASSKPMYHKTD